MFYISKTNHKTGISTKSVENSVENVENFKSYRCKNHMQLCSPPLQVIAALFQNLLKVFDRGR